MFQKLVNHNQDIKRLVEKGYAVSFDGSYLIIRDIPYLDENSGLKIGVIVSKIQFLNENEVQQEDHQILFAGSVPHGLDRTPIPNLAGGPITVALGKGSEDIIIERSFSNKPIGKGGFDDFFEKIESYVTIISGPAMESHDITPYTFRVVDQAENESVFNFIDTMTSRAEILDLSAKLKDDVVAIIGLGGTGGYVLDFLSKTEVKEIRAFDQDSFHVHNAFRSPGKLDPKEFKKSKAEVYYSRYENFRKGITVRSKFIDATCAEELDGVTFAFVCVDSGSSRKSIFDLLISLKIPFIDVGMGLRRKDDALTGQLRTTYYPAEKAKSIMEKGLAELNDASENIYRTSVQISELNALNACFAVIRFKQLRGFYRDELPQYHLLYELPESKMAGESIDAI